MRFDVYALVAGKNVDALLPQILEFRPNVVAVASESVLARLIERLEQCSLPRKEWPELFSGDRPGWRRQRLLRWIS